jgi:hypothetical protein
LLLAIFTLPQVLGVGSSATLRCFQHSCRVLVTDLHRIEIRLFQKAHQKISKMAGEILDRPNPQPLPSLIPEYVDNLLVKLDKPNLSPEIKAALRNIGVRPTTLLQL